MVGISYSKTFLIFSFIIVLFNLSFARTTITNKPTNATISLQLIHRNSILSPFYDPKTSIEELAYEIMNISEARLRYLSKKIEGGSSSYDDFEPPLVLTQKGFIFLVEISIGQPPLKQLLTLDTGSPLLWVRSSLCNGCIYGLKVYNSARSSTYSSLSCGSPQCTTYSLSKCVDRKCGYNIEYADKMVSDGDLALETFTLATSSGGFVQVPDILFGSARATENDNMQNIVGILGMKPSNMYNLFSGIGQKFSYCLGNVRDRNYMHNKLVLGEGAIIQGDTTPMQVENRNYVSLERIFVGDKEAEINEDDLLFNVVIDTGTELTFLVSSAFQPFSLLVDNLIGGVLPRVQLRNDPHHYQCYSGDMKRDLHSFPTVTLRFAEEADFELGPESLFFQLNRNTFCMAVLDSSAIRSRSSIIGVLAQQYYNIGFDIDAKQVSFQMIDCELLDD